jgi:hypothetical protein
MPFLTGSYQKRTAIKRVVVTEASEDHVGSLSEIGADLVLDADLVILIDDAKILPLPVLLQRLGRVNRHRRRSRQPRRAPRRHIAGRRVVRSAPSSPTRSASGGADPPPPWPRRAERSRTTRSTPSGERCAACSPSTWGGDVAERSTRLPSRSTMRCGARRPPACPGWLPRGLRTGSRAGWWAVRGTAGNGTRCATAAGASGATRGDACASAWPLAPVIVRAAGRPSPAPAPTRHHHNPTGGRSPHLSTLRASRAASCWPEVRPCSR